jgi:hypothetical protein
MALRSSGRKRASRPLGQDESGGREAQSDCEDAASDVAASRATHRRSAAELFEYRNTFAHASLEFKLSGPPDLHVEWSWLTVNNADAAKLTPIDLGVFSIWEFRFEALNQALKYVLGAGRFFVETQDLPLNQTDLRGALLQGEHDDWSLVADYQVDSWQEAVDWLFPTAVYADAEHHDPNISSEMDY